MSSVANDGTVYKANFWDISAQAYGSFYLSGTLSLFSSAEDVGLPMPDVERFYLEDGFLAASQQNMSGINDSYTANDPQVFHEHKSVRLVSRPLLFRKEQQWVVVCVIARSGSSTGTGQM